MRLKRGLRPPAVALGDDPAAHCPSAEINNISDVDFVTGRVTTNMYGGSFLCDADSCHDVNLANHLVQTFRLR